MIFQIHPHHPHGLGCCRALRRRESGWRFPRRIVRFREGKLAHEHIYGTRGSVLVQLGLLVPGSARRGQNLPRFPVGARPGSIQSMRMVWVNLNIISSPTDRCRWSAKSQSSRCRVASGE